MGGCLLNGGSARGGGCLPRGVCKGGGLGLDPLNRITDRCENITLPQTSFAGGKYR